MIDDPRLPGLAAVICGPGKVEVVRVRLVQLAALLVGLFALGARWGITGVALVVDGVLLLGLGWLLARARDHVDFSARRLFLAPAVALGAAVVAALGGLWLACGNGPGVCGNDWLVGGLKGALFVAVYGGALLALERTTAAAMLGQLRDLGLRRS